MQEGSSDNGVSKLVDHGIKIFKIYVIKIFPSQHVLETNYANINVTYQSRGQSTLSALIT
jgi:hypothetical protein